MKIRTLIGLSALGGVLYLHRKRGGEWTVDSFKDSIRQLWEGVQRGAEQAREQAKRTLNDAAREAERATASRPFHS